MVILNILIVLVILIVASYFDLKKKVVPGGIIYPLLVIGFLASLFPDTYINILIGSVVLGIGAILNKFKLLGGADVLLIVGVILMTPMEFMSVDFFLIFFLFSCIGGLLFYGIMWALKKHEPYIKFVPCILLGYIIAVYSMIRPLI
jgi:Flp pilus assembly protein protease CpaA